MFFKQLYLLLWKNVVIRKRHKIRTAIEIAWPLFLFAILVAIRSEISLERKTECHYRARAMPSAGVLPWLKGLMCNLQNPCSETMVSSEIPGLVNKPLNKTTTNRFGIITNLLKLLDSEPYLQDQQRLKNIFELGKNPFNLGPEIFGNALHYKEQLNNIYGPLKSLAENLPPFSSFPEINSSYGFMEFCGHPVTDGRTEGFMDGLSNLTSDLDLSSPSFCSNLTSKLEDKEDKAIYFFWQMVKPFMLGKIAYFPNTDVVNEIIKNSNTTFETLATIQQLGEDWQSSIGPKLYQQLENGEAVNFLRESLKNEEMADIVLRQLNIPVEQLPRLRKLLSNDYDSSNPTATWKGIYKEANATIVWITKILECSELDKFVGFSDKAEMVRYSMDLVGNKSLWGGITFLSPNRSDLTIPNIIKYEIRQDANTVTKTTRIERFTWKPGSESNSTDVNEKIALLHPVKYYISGFVHIQDMIESGIIVSSGGRHDNATLGTYLQEMPYPCYTRDVFLEFLPGLFSLLMTLAWVYSVCIIIKNIVYEKEKRLKEVMKMMGLSNGVHWVAWFINAFVMMLLSTVLMLLFLRFGKILPYSSLFIVLFWLMSFAFATIMQCFLISCFFTRANLAAACGGILFFVFYIPYNVVYVFGEEMTLSMKLVACLLSSVAFGYGAGYISQYEMSGTGVQLSNWATSPDPSDQMTFLISVVMMLVDGCIYMILTWYVENVLPGTYGVPKPWNFFLKRSYWLGPSKKKRIRPELTNPLMYQDDSVKLENEPIDLPLGVAMQQLRKVFDNGKVAVDNLSLNFYEGQITSFLGHNGAGKTTTMSMLTGLYTPSSGSAYIYGNDIHTEMDEIRHQLGFCPQHNVLFGDLTVLEHLEFYCGLKNAVGGQPEDKGEIKQMLKDVGLPHKKDEISRHLSGGMKRKLSVAVAFVGGSKCVILDEPTAGVDPYARRGIWDLLLRYRANRTILLSTHHMDEADLLGDRIAIISHGKLKCCGSSLFLKSNYGVGYYLTVVKNNDDEQSEASSASTPIAPQPLELAKVIDKNRDEGFGSSTESLITTPSRKYTLQQTHDSFLKARMPDTASVRSAFISDLVYKTIPKAKVQEENQREVTFILPYSGQMSGRFSKLFEKLDKSGISYGLTDTSLEEIFLNVAEGSRVERIEEDTKGCFCLPRKRNNSSNNTAAASSEEQARRGHRRSRSLTSNFSAHSLAPLVPNGHDSFLMEEFPNEANDEAFEIGDGSQATGMYRVKDKALVWQQFKALFVKRFHHAKRNRKGLIAQVVVPAGFVALGLLCALAAPKLSNLPALELQPWMYGNTSTFYSNDEASNELAAAVTESLLHKPSVGMRCVDQYKVTNYNDDPVTCQQYENGKSMLDDRIAGLSQYNSSDATLKCTCSSENTRVLLAQCPIGTGGVPTPRFRTQTSDWMYNMTGRNLSDWLVKTVDRFKQQRYGGLSIGERFNSPVTVQLLTPLIDLAKKYSDFKLKNVSDFAENIARSQNIKVWFNNNGYHSMPTWMNIKSNALLRSVLKPGSDPADYGIAVVNYPLNYTDSSIEQAARPAAITGTLVSVTVIFALSFIPASFVLFLIEEKITKSKHLQFVSGVNQAVYWISTFLWDMINYLFPVTIVILIFVCFQTKAYVSADNFPCLLCLLLFYGFAITPMMYPASFYFEVPSTAYVVLTCVNMFIGINASLITYILQGLNLPSLDAVNEILKAVFLIFPQYCLGRGLIEMSISQSYSDAYSSLLGVDSPVQPFAFSAVGRNLMALVIEGVAFFSITLLIQYRFFVKPHGSTTRVHSIPTRLDDLDEDVVAERKRILEGRSSDLLRIQNLSKVYRKRGLQSHLVAVDRLCLGVPEKECFGLLGVNGAGKTTTFKMLTGDTSPTVGDAHIYGQSILSNIRDVQQNTGYCPQFDALNSLLTGREHLTFYAKLRGVPPNETDRVADWAINQFGLKMYADKPTGTYSGGNKRKLSAAIAFIGCPPIVFLDEPTAGMDPMSRRFLWSRISEAVRGGRCIVLTSHSMEECEALCTRLAIMVNGKLKCIGSPQHLKNRYGEGYTITIKVAGLNPNLKAVQQFIKASLPSAVLKESHCNMMMYQLPFKDVKLAKLFVVMESNRKAMHIEDYSISQTTLDEVFVSFAKNQTDDLEDEYGFQPLNDDAVLDFSQRSDQIRELAGSSRIAMQTLSEDGLYEYQGFDTSRLRLLA